MHITYWCTITVCVRSINCNIKLSTITFLTPLAFSNNLQWTWYCWQWQWRNVKYYWRKKLTFYTYGHKCELKFFLLLELCKICYFLFYFFNPKYFDLYGLVVIVQNFIPLFVDIGFLNKCCVFFDFTVLAYTIKRVEFCTLLTWISLHFVHLSVTFNFQTYPVSTSRNINLL